MNLAHAIRCTLLSGLAVFAASCSSGSGGGTSVGTVQSSLQDLTLDPDGTTTVITFTQAPGAVDSSYFSSDGGQTVSTASAVGNVATVVWNTRVSPSDVISVTGMPGIYDGATTPTSSDTGAPTFSITNTSMVAGLGGDTIEVTFSGPRVDEIDAEDFTSWTLKIGTTTLDLTGSTFVLDTNTQVMAMTLGAEANLHPAFTLAATSLVSVSDTVVAVTPVAGTASGDASAPTLTGVTQNLAADEYGRVVDFTFSEAMDPAFSEKIANFGASGSNVPTTVTQPSAGILRVTFNSTVLPGTATVTASNMMDVHGNTVSVPTSAITQPSPVASTFSTNSAVTVSDVGGDYIEAVFSQGFMPASAVDDTKWSLVVDGDTITMGSQTLSYDFLLKKLRIDLNFDMVNGTAFTLTGVSVVEVDGQTFSSPGASTVSGDVIKPTIISVVQNRTQDPTGYTLDVSFSEDLEGTPVANTANWAVPGLTVASATLLGTPNKVRVVLTGGAAVPGINTLSSSNQVDLAGNAIVAVTGRAMTSTDSSTPSIISAAASAAAGADNDTVTVWFDDFMVGTQVEDPTFWTLESPAGNTLNTTGATVVYNDSARSAVLTLDANDVNFELGNAFKVTMDTMTDISANTVTSDFQSGAIAFERVLPYAHAAWRDNSVSTRLVMRFSEHMNYLTDLYDASINADGVRYIVRTSGGALRGSPTTATVLDSGLGVQLDFGFVINASDTMDVMGLTDLVGNYMYPGLAMALPIEDVAEPDWGAQSAPLLAVPGERNDVITLIFDRNLTPWGTEDYRNFTINDGSVDIDLSGASFAFDGMDTVVITMDSNSASSLKKDVTHSFSVDGLRTVQGVAMSSSSALPGNAVTGDITTPPAIASFGAKIDRSFTNAILVYVDEALDPVASESEGSWLYSGASPTSATTVDPTTMRLVFAVAPASGSNLAYNLIDLAGNATGAGAHVVAASETIAPILSNVSGTSVPGEGGDYITVAFSEPVDTGSGLLASNYSVLNGGSSVAIVSTGAWYESATYSVNFYLASGVELNSSQSVSVTVDSITDHSLNMMASPVTLSGTVTGDTSTPPAVTGAYANFRENVYGLFVDVLFSEAPDSTFITNPPSWNITGGGAQVVLGVTRVSENEYRVSLSGALNAGEELEIVTGLPDLAGNVAGSAIPVTVAE